MCSTGGRDYVEKDEVMNACKWALQKKEKKLEQWTAIGLVPSWIDSFLYKTSTQWEGSPCLGQRIHSSSGVEWIYSSAYRDQQVLCKQNSISAAKLLIVHNCESAIGRQSQFF